MTQPFTPEELIRLHELVVSAIANKLRTLDAVYIDTPEAERQRGLLREDILALKPISAKLATLIQKHSSEGG